MDFWCRRSFNFKSFLLLIPLSVASYAIYRHVYYTALSVPRDTKHAWASNSHTAMEKHSYTDETLPPVDHIKFSSELDSNSNTETKLSPTSTYLKLTNTLHEELSLGPVEESTKLELENLIRSGHDLKPYTTERGEPALIENGIVYQPWRRPDPASMHKTYPSPYSTEYEAYIPFDEETFFEGRKPNPSYKSEPKIILWDTPTRYTAPKKIPQEMKLCPEFPCRITTNRQYSQKSSAMIFAGQILKKAPPKRRPDQMFVLQNHEPPYTNQHFDSFWVRGFKQPAWKKVFNWTMTYRMDSDFIAPYGIVRKRPTPLVQKDYKSIVASKTKVAAWLVSNCKTSSTREAYVKELKKYIDIDVYGGCGNLKCPHVTDGKCATMIADKYKFYLSFESAICPDYITEKFFHYLTMDTILVVRGSDQYYQHAPREIFLNTASFPSPKELAQRMLSLHKNDDAYIQLLKEKDKYMSLVEGFPVRNPDGYIRFMAYRFESLAICRMCQRLWNLDKYAKSIPDIHQWFDKKICHKADDLTF